MLVHVLPGRVGHGLWFGVLFGLRHWRIKGVHLPVGRRWRRRFFWCGSLKPCAVVHNYSCLRARSVRSDNGLVSGIKRSRARKYRSLGRPICFPDVRDFQVPNVARNLPAGRWGAMEWRIRDMDSRRESSGGDPPAGKTTTAFAGPSSYS